MSVDAELLEDAEHGQQFRAFQGEPEEGAQVEALHAPRLAPDQGNDEPDKQEHEQAEQEIDVRHGRLLVGG